MDPTVLNSPAKSKRSLLQIGSATTAGVRPDNQDRLTHFDSKFGHVFVVADGMGGYRGGAVASSIAIERLPELLRGLPDDLPPQAALVQGIEDLNRAIIQKSRDGGEAVEGMGSTLAALLVRDTPDGSLAIGAHVGDSRIYFLRGGHLFGLTRDHTVVGRLVESGALTPEQARDHPQSGVLTRVLGRIENVPVELTSWTLLQGGDTFLLCSDGLSGYAEDEAIRQALLDAAPPEVIATRLMELALREGSQDNISVLLCRAVAAPSPPEGGQPGA